MSTVFTWMVAGLAVTAAAAYYAAASELYLTVMQGMGRWVLLLGAVCVFDGHELWACSV